MLTPNAHEILTVVKCMGQCLRLRFAISTVDISPQPVGPLQYSLYGQLVQSPLYREPVICKRHILTILNPFAAAGMLLTQNESSSPGQQPPSKHPISSCDSGLATVRNSAYSESTGSTYLRSAV